jgi:hypothetical protein
MTDDDGKSGDLTTTLMSKASETLVTETVKALIGPAAERLRFFEVSSELHGGGRGATISAVRA